MSTGPYLSWTGDCDVGYLEIVISSPPSHGEITIEPEDGRIGNVVTGTLSDCKGKLLPGKSVIYHPEGDFVGTDEFTVDVTYETKQTIPDTYVIEVSR